MFCRKSLLAFVLAFAALTLGRSQQAMGQDWGWDWGELPPGFIDGGSTAFVYHCTQGQGTNNLTLGDPDIFVSSGTVVCDFTGQFKGNDIQCSYDLTFTGDLVSCVDTSAGALVTLRSTCDNVEGVSGSLSCPAQPNNLNPAGTFPGVNDLLGISNSSECRRLFGRNADTLFTQATYAGQTCDEVVITNNAGLAFGGLTKTTTNLCHSDGGSSVDCITPGGVTNKSTSEIPNLVETACVASPQTWNVDCSGGSSTRDQGKGTACYVNGAPGFPSFDPTKLDATTATLNGVPVDTKKGKAQCTIKDCNGDGVLDFQCTFPTCDGTTATAGDGDLTMITSFQSNTGDISGLTCTTTVATSGQGS